MNKKSRRIILVGGVFDILHIGHIEFLKKAKNLGGYLIVALESDKNVRRLKGKNRPIHNQKQRKKMLESLKFVDEAVILKDKMTDHDYEVFTTKINPSIIAVTKEDPNLEKKKSQAKKLGAKVVEIPKIKTRSTTQIAKLLKL